MADKIKNLRAARRLTQKQLAEALNISDKAVSKWERGLSYPDVTLLPALARELGVTVDELLSGEGQGVADALPVAECQSKPRKRRRWVWIVAIGAAVALLICASVPIAAAYLWNVSSDILVAKSAGEPIRYYGDSIATLQINIPDDSMSPTLVAGDTVTVQQYVDNIGVGDIIAVNPGLDPDVYLVRRVVKIDTTGSNTSIITKGDANAADDPPIPMGGQVVGRVIAVEHQGNTPNLSSN